MCIILLTTSHPSYSLILLSNRDEYLSRPTADAGWWSLSQHDIPSSKAAEHDPDPGEQLVLSGRDLRHPSHGTWLGITQTGRIAALTNFRDGDETEKREQREGQGVECDTEPVDLHKDQRSAATSTQTKRAKGNRSRGEITKEYLTSYLRPEEWAERFLDEQRRGEWGDMGGFTLLFGEVVTSSGNGSEVRIASLSNRTVHLGEFTWLAGGPDERGMPGDGKETGESESGKGVMLARACALSNTTLADKSWDKVKIGEKALQSLLADKNLSQEPGKEPQRDIDRQREELLRQCLDILSRDTMPPRQEDEDWASYSRQLRRSILIPPIQAGDDTYGTQKQTVLLIDRKGTIP